MEVFDTKGGIILAILIIICAWIAPSANAFEFSTGNTIKDYNQPVFEDRCRLLLYACDFVNVKYYELGSNGKINKYYSKQLSLVPIIPQELEYVKITYKNGTYKEFKRIKEDYSEYTAEEQCFIHLWDGCIDSYYNDFRDGAYQYSKVFEWENITDDEEMYNELCLTEAYLLYTLDEYEKTIYYAEQMTNPEDKYYSEFLINDSKLIIAFT